MSGWIIAFGGILRREVLRFARQRGGGIVISARV